MPIKSLSQRIAERLAKESKKVQTADGTDRLGSLHEKLRKLGTRTTDADYQRRYNDAPAASEKGKVLADYAEQFPDLFAKSRWVKTALADFPHFPITHATPENATAENPATDFAHSDDYRSIRWNNAPHQLTTQQAQIVQMLHGAHKDGLPALSQDYMLERLGVPNSRLRDSFKRSRLWNTLIVRGQKKGTYRLNLSPAPEKTSI